MSGNEIISLDNEVFVEVATNVITDAMQTGWNKVKKFFETLNAKESIYYGKAYITYLQNTYNRNSKIKTLIYRRVPKELYSFYECIGVYYKNKTIDTSSICNLLNVNNKLLITGTGGIGKSILFKHLFINTIKESEYIPVLIELRKFNNLDLKEISIYSAIYQNLCNNGFKLADEYYAYSLEEGGYVILLDGFDEVDRQRVSKVQEEIKNFSAKYHKNKFIVSSRPTDAFIGWNDFHEMRACNLTKDQALSLIDKIEFDESVKQTFYKALEHSLFEKYNSFASNPLLLTIMLLTFNNHASIPEQLNDFYEEAFATLFNMHDATKDCYVRDIRSSLGCEDFKMVFSYICFKSYFKSEFEFSETRLREYIQLAKEKFEKLIFSVDDFQEDLILSVCMLVKEGLNYRFTHRSFQEYFAAWYTCKLTDDIQTKLLTEWLSETNSVLTDNYINMLFNFQPDKVNKIILCPGIKIIKDIYNSEGFSFTLLDKFFYGMRIVKKAYNQDGEKKYNYHVMFMVKNRYLCNIARVTCILNNYESSEFVTDENINQELLKKIVDIRNERTQDSQDLDFDDILLFDEVLSIITSDELLSCLENFDSQLRFCFDIYEKYSENTALRKRKLASIVDEL